MDLMTLRSSTILTDVTPKYVYKHCWIHRPQMYFFPRCVNLQKYKFTLLLLASANTTSPCFNTLSLASWSITSSFGGRLSSLLNGFFPGAGAEKKKEMARTKKTNNPTDIMIPGLLMKNVNMLITSDIV